MASNGVIRLRKGFDIKLVGEASKNVNDASNSDVVSLNPPDFRGVIPKLMVAAGDEVLAGQPIFYSKDNPEIKFVSPVSGEVAEVVRGAKRRIMEIRIIADKSGVRYQEFPKGSAASMSREAVVERMLESGVWPYLQQRPFGILAQPDTTPKSIFVSCFDSAPLAPDMGMIINADAENFKAGLAALKVLSNGNLHVGVESGQSVPTDGASAHTFNGPHPAGNVGVQIHHVDPIKAGEAVWTVNAQDVLIIGRLFHEGRFRADRTIALTGACVSAPQYYNVKSGQRLSDILAGKLTGDKCRLIEGNVLTGKTSNLDSFLGAYTNQITAIPEGDESEFLGWIAPGLSKLSRSRSYFSWLMPKKKYNLSTNLQGEYRNFVVSGQYEPVMPMNIMPVFLLKAIMANDIERMEALGIYEVVEEDLALCEFVCTSKTEIQKILREGLDMMRAETM